MIIKYGWRLLLIAPLILAFGVYVNNGYKTNNPVCPDNIKDSEKRSAEFKKWIDNFYEDNPNASTNDTMEYRRNFLAKNNCKKALKTYNFYITTNGKVVEEITKAEGTIREQMLQEQTNPICPDDFEDPKQEIASFVKWGEEFWVDNPSATVSDFSQARINFWRENNCTEALKRYEDYMAGNVDEETKRLIEIVIKEEMKKAIFNR